MRLTWVQPEDLIRHELRQSAQQGRDVADIRRRWAATGLPVAPPYGGASGDVADPRQRALAVELLDELDRMPDPTAGAEPDGWPEIVATLGPDTDSPAAVDRTRLRGAWWGRIVGCVLGKPVEKIPRQGIEEILRGTGRWPLQRYFTAVGLDPDVTGRWPWNKASRGTSLEENISGVPEDDDINYTLMALRLLENRLRENRLRENRLRPHRAAEQHGADFTADDVARAWLLDLPVGRAFTAERVALRNLLEGLSPPATALTHNPFREFIGAQIRTDLYGWVNPGRPRRAAEWAWRDASVSHARNGLYGAMFVAAAASVAVTGAGIDAAIDAGTAVVPPTSRMATAIRLGRELGADPRYQQDPRGAYQALETAFADVHWVHALNNMALVCFALTAGRGDVTRTLGLTVMGGWDTDSNGATVGGLIGAAAGPGAIAEHWTRPLAGGLHTSIPGENGVAVDTLIERTAAVAAAVASPVLTSERS
ncbi:ADP-ribosylglycohydrolase family protein [Nakamurella aerolata]|uniref:ADP-ribosylglycohydrolase family protein n=1 Tax=Nakamurella aerolata TaxID=1656892 RepID=A0A849A2B2_9ACTN|nr:ADP-ribosylglycohydrolase family protein [Nakamurella aerolata]